VDEIAADVDSLLTKNGFTVAEVLGIGIGSPGPINLITGVLGTLPNLPGWENFPLRDAAAQATNLPTILECDANAAAIAEWKLGAGQESGLDSMAMITLGTGVGSGLVLAGQVWHGMFGMGGEVGHATVEPDGLLCSCGTRGCLEMYASANGLLRLAKKIAASAETSQAFEKLVCCPEGFTPQQIADLARQENDPAAKLAFERLGSYLGIGIANLINILDLPMIVVGGGVASAWELFAPAMFRAVREYSVIYRLVAPTQLMTMEKNCTFIRPALLGPSAGLMGAALLPRLASLSSERGSAITADEVVR
jgi:glucokinase